MATESFDLLIIGGGSGGVGMGRRAASYGAKVAICEEDRYGGTCVHRGCVPKKLLVYASAFREEFKLAQGFGWTLPGEPTFDWPTMRDAKSRELDRLNDWYNKMLVDTGIERVLGRARFLDPHTVQVGDRQVTAKTIVIAVGGWPFVPDVPGRELAITSNEAFLLEKLPRQIAIVGSGYIGVEFAGIFRGMGSEVTLTFRSDKLLPKFDEDIRTHLTEEMTRHGIRIVGDNHVREIRPDALVTDQGTFECDTVMYATGRMPNTKDLGLELAGVKTDPKTGAVIVDEHLRTNVDHIYALGDVIDKVALTPVAIAEGRGLAETLYHSNPTRVSYENIATAVFSQPQVGTVGLSEAEAREKHKVRIFRTRFRPMKHVIAGNEGKVMLKIVVDAESDRVLGCHMVGPDAAEIIQSLGVAITCRATKAQFDKTIALHPSIAEEFVTMREPVKEAIPQ